MNPYGSPLERDRTISKPLLPMSELRWLRLSRRAGVRRLSSLAAVFLGISLFFNQGVFESSKSFTPLRGVPEWSMGCASVLIGVAQAITPRGFPRLIVLALGSLWWLWWCVIITYGQQGLSTGTGTYLALCIGVLWEFYDEVPRRGKA